MRVGGATAASPRPEGGHRSQGQRRREAPRAAALREPRGAASKRGTLRGAGPRPLSLSLSLSLSARLQARCSVLEAATARRLS